MTSEPVIEKPRGDVGGGDGVGCDPVPLLILIDFHRNMRHLGHKSEPPALEQPEISRIAL